MRKRRKTKTPAERTYGRLIALYGEMQPRARLEKKGISRGCLKQLELAGQLRPVREGGQVSYLTQDLGNCWRALRDRGIRLNMNEWPGGLYSKRFFRRRGLWRA